MRLQTDSNNRIFSECFVTYTYSWNNTQTLYYIWERYSGKLTPYIKHSVWMKMNDGNSRAHSGSERFPDYCLLEERFSIFYVCTGT